MTCWPWAAPPWGRRCWRRRSLSPSSPSSGRKVALFGSYGWGDGQWMRDWQERVEGANADLYQGQGLIVNETPDDSALEQCRAFGAGFAAY